jgi:nucleoside recognition membrane protein YjiH
MDINFPGKVKVKEKQSIIQWDTVIFIAILGGFFGILGAGMGVANMFSTLMATAYKLLLDTVLYILAIAVLAGAFGKLAGEFGVIELLNKIFAPLMKPLYGLPGVAFLGVITTYLSDNPAIIALAREKGYLGYFEKHKVPCLCNLGTAFGMGLIVTTFMMGLGYFREALIGNLGAIIGSIVSVRLMNHKTKKLMRASAADEAASEAAEEFDGSCIQEKTEGSFFIRFLTAMLEGGKSGVEVGMSIIPGVLIVCTVIMMLTFGPADTAVGYQGLAYEGVAVLPKLGSLLSPIIRPLFGFASPEAIAFPITSLGAVGAALSLVPKFLESGIIGSNEIAVFTAMGMCWSGYLSTHIAMMDALNQRKLIGAAIGSHTIGGLAAGIAAHYLVLLLI